MANPKVFSYLERGIKIENVNEGVPINIFLKKGIPVAFRLEQDTQYLQKKIKVERNNEHADIVKKEVIPNKKIISLLNTMKESMFSCDTTIYSFYHEGKIYSYDCVSNTNHFPYCDLEKISKSKKFHYEDLGFYLLEPILSGYFKAEDIIAFYDKFLKENTDKKAKDLFIMPQFPAFDSTTYRFKDLKYSASTTTICAEDDLQDIIDKIIKEEENISFEEDDKLTNLPLLEGPDNFNGVLLASLDGNSVEEKAVEFTKIYVKKYIERKNIQIYEEEESLLDDFCLLFAIWSNKDKQSTILNTLKSTYPEVATLGRALRKDPYGIMAKAFVDTWSIHEKKTIDKATKKKLFLVTDFVRRVFREEIEFYLSAFQISYAAYFGSYWVITDLPKV